MKKAVTGIATAYLQAKRLYIFFNRIKLELYLLSANQYENIFKNFMRNFQKRLVLYWCS